MIYRCLGLMSGTSLDGVDGAICITDGSKIIGFENSYFRPYTKTEQSILRSKFGSWPENGGFEDAIDIIHSAHLDVIKAFPDAELIGFHGQTLNHDPKNLRTFQLGNGATLAKLSNKRVIWDFRTADVAAGGEGAPLAPFFHFACAKTLNISEKKLAFVNLGGVGNISLIDTNITTPDMINAVIAFDTGPANAPLNDFILERTGQLYDLKGSLALSGNVDQDILSNFMKFNFFNKKPPKSLDRNSFSAIQDLVSTLSDADGAATLTAICVESVYAAQSHLKYKPYRWLISGGGRHNIAIMTGLRQRLDQPVDPVESVGLNGDMLEAQAFGYLAARVVNNLSLSSPTTTGCLRPTKGGVISDP